MTRRRGRTARARHAAWASAGTPPRPPDRVAARRGEARVLAHVADGGRVYAGVSSREALSAVDDGYPCCALRGRLVALDAVTGELLWRAYLSTDHGQGASFPHITGLC
ncbi:PQQ-binding-like beta-propeller repeat protein [Sorangium cellulosum]